MLAKLKVNSFFFEVGEWFSDLKDNIILADFNAKIKALEEELDWCVLGSEARRQIVAELGLYIETRDKVWDRIAAREARHEAQRLRNKQAVAH